MTISQYCNVTNTQLIISLPPSFNNKRVLVTVDDNIGIEAQKMALMMQAAKDPLFLADLRDVNADFEGIEHGCFEP